MTLWHNEFSISIPTEGDVLQLTFSPQEVRVEYVMSLTGEVNWTRIIDRDELAHVFYNNGDPVCVDCGIRLRHRQLLCGACTDQAIRDKQSQELYWGSDEEREVEG